MNEKVKSIRTKLFNYDIELDEIEGTNECIITFYSPQGTRLTFNPKVDSVAMAIIRAKQVETKKVDENLAKMDAVIEKTGGRRRTPKHLDFKEWANGMGYVRTSRTFGQFTGPAGSRYSIQEIRNQYDNYCNTSLVPQAKEVEAGQ